MGRADVYSDPLAPDPVLDAHTVLALARRHVGDVRFVRSVDESGGEARVYHIDEHVVVKTQRPHRRRPRTSLRKEMLVLDQLASTRLSGCVPAVFGYGAVETPHGAVEYLCLSRMAGQAVATTAVAAPQRPAIIGEVAAILRELHSVDLEPIVVAGECPADNDAHDLRQRLEFAFGDLADALAARPASWPVSVAFEDVVQQALESLPTTMSRRAVLHSNPGPTHTFIDPRSYRVTGLIDFGDAYASHPALDLRSWPHPTDRQYLYDSYCRDAHPDDAFRRVWRVAMIHADARAIVSGWPEAEAAAAGLMSRLGRP